MTRFARMVSRMSSYALLREQGEVVRFRNPGGRPRAVTAIVDRSPAEDEAQAPFSGRRPPTFVVKFPRNVSNGVSPHEVEEDSSEVDVAMDQGGEPRWRLVTRQHYDQPGWTVVEVRA